VSEILFNKNLTTEALKAMNMRSLKMVSQEIPSFNIPKDLFSSELKIENLLTTNCPIFSSLGEFRRAVKNNAVSINKLKISDPDYSIDSNALIQDKYIMVENGKKNKYIIELN